MNDHRVELPSNPETYSNSSGNYYPFGLTMAGISDQAMLKPENRFKYNGIELNHKEFSDGSGLELYTAQFRGIDPQIGGWWQVDPKSENVIDQSPYNSMGDKPIIHADPLGDLFFGLFGSTGEQRRAARSVAKATGGEVHNSLSRKIHVDYSTTEKDFNFNTGKSQDVFVSHSVSFRGNGHIDLHDPVRNEIYDQDLAWSKNHIIDRNGNVHFIPASGRVDYVPVEALLVPLPPVLRTLGRAGEAARTVGTKELSVIRYTEQGETFIRYESGNAAFSRITSTGGVTPGTYAAPASDGMISLEDRAATYNLPTPEIPRTNVITLQPPAGTPIIGPRPVVGGTGNEVLFPLGY